MYCEECGSEMILSTDPIASEFRGIKFNIENVSHYKCMSCGEEAFDIDDADIYEEKVKDTYREICGLLKPGEIKDIRKKLGLNQMEFQSLIGVGKTTVSRWETGAIVQQKPEDNLIRAVSRFPAVRNALMEKTELRVGRTGTERWILTKTESNSQTDKSSLEKCASFFESYKINDRAM